MHVQLKLLAQPKDSTTMVSRLAFVAQVFSIQVGCKTGPVPPPSRIDLGAVASRGVIVSVRGREGHGVVVPQSVTGRASVASHGEFVV